MTFFIIIVIAIAFAIPKLKTREQMKKGEAEISFKEAMDLVEVPVVTFRFPQNNKVKKLNFIIDTGASSCFIDKNVISLLDNKKLAEKDDDEVVYSASGLTESEVVKYYLDFYYENSNFNAKFAVIDLSEPIAYIKETNGVTIAGMIGSDFFKQTKTKIDFESLKIKIHGRYS